MRGRNRDRGQHLTAARADPPALVPAKIPLVRVGTPLGEYPFEFSRIERRDGSIAIVGTVAGMESTVVLDHRDLTGALKKLALPVGVALALVAFSRARG